MTETTASPRTMFDELDAYVTSKLAGRELDARKAFAALVRSLEKTCPPQKAKSDAEELAERWLSRAEAEAAAEQVFETMTKAGKFDGLDTHRRTINHYLDLLRPQLELLGTAWREYSEEIDRLADDNDPLAELIMDHNAADTSDMDQLLGYLSGDTPKEAPAVLERLEKVEGMAAELAERVGGPAIQNLPAASGKAER